MNLPITGTLVGAGEGLLSTAEFGIEDNAAGVVLKRLDGSHVIVLGLKREEVRKLAPALFAAGVITIGDTA